MSGVNPTAADLDMEVYVSAKDTTIYIKLTGFDDLTNAEEYAEYLTKNLPLLLMETEVIH
jgi:hypothetical protein